jgi:hypothetical protein
MTGVWHPLTGFPRRHEGLEAGKENGTKVPVSVWFSEWEPQ